MNQNLGKFVICYILFIPLYLSSSTLCDINSKLNKTSLAVGEEGVLNIEIKQIDHSGAMFFEFIKPKVDALNLTLINKDEKKLKDNSTMATFKYRVSFSKSGLFTIPISIKVKQASYESVNSFNTGSADELENLKTNDTIIDGKPIKIEVKELKKGVKLVGDFKLLYKYSKTHLKAFEPLYASYDIVGDGSDKSIDKLIDDIKGVDIFLEKRGEFGFDYVFVSDSNFTIPKITIPCYSPTKKIYYDLTIPKQDITVTKENLSNILDHKNSYDYSSFKIEDLLPYINAILIFLSGYIIGRYRLFEWRTNSKIEDEFLIKVKKAKDEKELLKLLLSNDTKKYSRQIEELEDMIYKNHKGSLKSIKDWLLNH